MSVTGARATNDNFIHGIVVFLIDLWPIVEEIIAERVQFCEVDPDVGNL